MALLTVKNISRTENGNIAVQQVSFKQQPLQKIAIAGETGSGKSNLLKMIAGWVQPDAGEIVFEDQKVTGPDEQLIPGHPGIAFLSQYFELRHHMWVHEILEYANEWPPQKANELYALCDIAHLVGRRTDQLSGGEAQRVALARLLSMKPKLLLLDEPFSNLDIIHKNSLKKVIDAIGEKMEISCIMVSHDATDILSWADTIFLMKEGKIVQQGRPQEVYYQPADAYCAGLLGDYNLLDIPGQEQQQQAKQNGKKLFLRPEQVRAAVATADYFQATVKDVFFCGSYYRLNVWMKEQVICVHTTENIFKKGDLVSLSWQSERPWFLQA